MYPLVKELSVGEAQRLVDEVVDEFFWKIRSYSYNNWEWYCKEFGPLGEDRYV